MDISSRYTEAYANPSGPGDARPTALQIVKDEGLLNKLTDKVVLITGGSSGLGVETARALHATGATVYVTGRDLVKTQAVVDEILAKDEDPNAKKAPIHILKMELDSFASIKAGAEEFLKKSDKLNVLICNAGVMAPPEGRTKDGFETQFGTNHLGHFLLFQLLKSTLLSSSTADFHSRVVTVSSIGHRMGPVRFHDFNFEKEAYSHWPAYGQSKTANIYMANQIERQYGGQNLHGLSVHPGLIHTGLPTHVDAKAVKPETKGSLTPSDMYKVVKNAEQGAVTQVYAAIGKEFEGKGGIYLADCSIQGPYNGSVDEPMDVKDSGYAPWILDEDAEKKLWDESMKLVGL